MHSTDAAKSSDYCSVLELNLNISNRALLDTKVTVDFLKPFTHLLEVSIHLLLHLFKLFNHLRLHIAKVRCNEVMLTEEHLPFFFFACGCCIPSQEL